MATRTPESVTSYPASADFTALKWPRLAVVSAGRLVGLCGAGARPDGLLMNNPDVGEQGRVQTYDGQAQEKIEAGGTFAAGIELASDAVGRVVAAVSGNQIVGVSNEAGVIGRIIGFVPERRGLKP